MVAVEVRCVIRYIGLSVSLMLGRLLMCVGVWDASFMDMCMHRLGIL